MQKYSSAQMHLGKFGALELRKTGLAKQDVYYFELLENTALRYRHFLEKAASLDIQTICPLHGPSTERKSGLYLNLHQTWSAYEPEDKGVLIAYTSVCGNTKES